MNLLALIQQVDSTLAVDHTKFGRNAMVNLGSITELHLLITDQEPPEEIVSILNKNDIYYEVTSK